MTDKTPTTVDDDEFYIGYAPPMPPRYSSFVTRAIGTLVGGAAVWAGVVASGHVRLDGGTFNFGHPESFSGTIVERPYPALVPDAGAVGRDAALLLVASGKHGAVEMVRGFAGRHVTLKGTRIHRASATMIEIEDGSLTATPAPRELMKADTTPAESPTDRQVKTFIGEIVDSKCFLGVMVPGEGKTHKDCASLCLRGGIPPALLVRNPDGTTSLLLLTSVSGAPIGPRVLEVAGEMIAVSGRVEEQQGWQVIVVESGFPPTPKVPARRAEASVGREGGSRIR